MGLFDVFKKKEEKKEEEKKQETVQAPEVKKVEPVTPAQPAAGRNVGPTKTLGDALADKLAKSSLVQETTETAEEAKVKAEEIIAEVKEKMDEAKEADLVALAKQVIRGDWGNGAERKAKLEAAGHNYSEVQSKVNELLGIKVAEKKEEAPAEEKKTVEQIAREVIKGKWGNGGERKKRLEEAGYSYSEVQSKVNQILSKK